MSFPFNKIEFRRNAVEPVECIKAGWNLIKSQYWLFAGIAVVGMLIGSVVPLGLMLGPMMCGIYLALFQTRRGRPIEFAVLFKGIDYFGDALIATLLHLIPIVIVVVPTVIVFYIGMVGAVILTASQREPNPGALLGVFGLFVVVWFVLMALLIVLSVAFTFAYPLIVDRRLSGLEAVKLSIRAGFANFWRLLGMLLLTGLISSLGLVLCFVGVYLLLPITFAAIASAYEQVFGLSDLQTNPPPPPPAFI